MTLSQMDITDLDAARSRHEAVRAQLIDQGYTPADHQLFDIEGELGMIVVEIERRASN